jgi:hypothetical protein
VREVTVVIQHRGEPAEVRADVQKFGISDYQVNWCDKAAVAGLGLSVFALGQLMKLCAEAYERLETERELAGIASLLADEAGVCNSDRDHRQAEVA